MTLLKVIKLNRSEFTNSTDFLNSIVKGFELNFSVSSDCWDIWEAFNYYLSKDPYSYCIFVSTFMRTEREDWLDKADLLNELPNVKVIKVSKGLSHYNCQQFFELLNINYPYEDKW